MKVKNTDLINKVKKEYRGYLVEWNDILSTTKNFDTKHLRRFCKNYVPKCQHVRVALSTIFAKRRQMQYFGPLGIVPSRGRIEKVTINNVLIELFKTYYSQEGSSVKGAYKKTFETYSAVNPETTIENFPLRSSFTKALLAEGVKLNK